MLTMYPEARRKVARLLGEIEAEARPAPGGLINRRDAFWGGPLLGLWKSLTDIYLVKAELITRVKLAHTPRAA